MDRYCPLAIHGLQGSRYNRLIRISSGAQDDFFHYINKRGWIRRTRKRGVLRRMKGKVEEEFLIFFSHSLGINPGKYEG